MVDLIPYFQPQEGDMVALLRKLVEIESPSHDKAAVDRMGEQVGTLMSAFGGQVQRFPRTDSGDILLGRWGEERSTPPILLLCHMDTVWPVGTLAGRPLRIEEDQFYGPGAYDMKGGIAIALIALRGLHALGLPLPSPVELLCTGDEETGSHASRSLMEELASRSRLVLCMEPALPGGALKTSRKGVGGFTVRVEGRAAHAGADHQKGINAILEMAHQVLALQAITDYTVGTTVNVGLIRGGTTSNVVPASCEIEVDFRVAVAKESERILQAMVGLRPRREGAVISYEGGLNRPPMVRDALMVQTFERAKRIAGHLGLDLHEGSTGGASDANFIAPLGVPVLDGLGADGNGGHAVTEHVRIPSLPERSAFLTALLSEWPPE